MGSSNRVFTSANFLKRSRGNNRSIIASARQSVIEPLEMRQMMSVATTITPVNPPVNSIKLTGTVIGTPGSYKNLGNTIAKVFDGNPGSYFDAPNSASAWAGMDLGSPQLITQLQYLPRVGFASRMVGGSFQGSTTADFSSGVIALAIISAAPAAGSFTVLPVNDSIGVQYVRYLSPKGGYANIAELEFDGTPATVLPPPPAPDVPAMISSSEVSPGDVQLTWTEDADSSDAASFTIERQGTGDADFVIIGTVPGTRFSYDDTSSAAGASYSYIIFASNAGGTSAPSTAMSVTLAPPPSNPWTDTDIGAPAITGSATLNLDGTVNVNGGGADIWGQTDSFNFNSQPMTGNGRFIARITAESNTNGWAKSGIMIRESTDADSRFVALFLTPGNGLSLEARTATHTNPSLSTAVPAKANVWAQLVRNGSVFTASYSPDNVTWTILGTISIPMVNNVYAGFAVTAHDNKKLCSAKFSNASLTMAGVEASAWTSGANAPMNRWESQSFSYNNMLYIFGGFIDRTLNATTECDAYNPATNSWTVVTTMPTGAISHAATVVVGDTAYFAGGNIGSFADIKTGVCTAAVLSYNLTTGVWGSVASLPAAVSCGGMVCINNQLIYFGGLNANNTVDLSATWSLDLTDPAAIWTAKAAMPNARNHIGYASINGIAYAVGGQHLYKESTGNDSEVDAYNPLTDKWSKVASLPVGRGAIHTTTMVVNNRIILVGGQTNGGYDGIYSSNISEYDPATNTWITAGTLPEANEGQSIAYINGQLLVADGTVDNLGGWSQNQILINSEITL